MNTTSVTSPPKLEAPRSNDHRSSTLFIQILCDIATMAYRLPRSSFLAAEIWNNDIKEPDIIGLTLMPSEDLDAVERVRVGATLSQMFRDIDNENLDHKIFIDPLSAQLHYADKIELYKIFKYFIRHSEAGLLSVDMMEPRIKRRSRVMKDGGIPVAYLDRNQMVTETIAINGALGKKLMNDDNNFQSYFFSSEPVPLLSLSHFFMMSAVAGQADISVSLSHLLKTICYEDKIPVPLLYQEPYPAGGYN